MLTLRNVLVGGLLIALVAMVIPMQSRAIAQDGGDDAELVERLLNLEPLSSYDSYTLTSDDTTAVTFDISFAGFGLASTETADFEAVSTVIADDGTGYPNVQVMLTGNTTTLESGFGQNTITTTTVVAEFRLVEGALYLNVTEQATDDEDVTLLPMGWQRVAADVNRLVDLDATLTDRFTDTVLDGFQFNIIVNAVGLSLGGGVDRGESVLDLFSNTEELADLLESVVDLNLKQQRLPDGRTVDAIGLGLNFETLMSLGADDLDLGLPTDDAGDGDTEDAAQDAAQDAAMSEAISAIFEDLVLDLNILIDDEDRFAGFGFDIGIAFDAADFAGLMDDDAPNTDGMELAADLQLTSLQLYSNYNADFAPVSAPLDAVPFE